MVGVKATYNCKMPLYGSTVKVLADMFGGKFSRLKKVDVVLTAETQKEFSGLSSPTEIKLPVAPKGK